MLVSLPIVAVVMNHWSVIFDQEEKVINQLYSKFSALYSQTLSS